VLAVLLALLVVRTGRLGAAIIAHASFNALNLAVAALR
jgi:membrane protease YdiL (CAAX protease family)